MTLSYIAIITLTKIYKKFKVKNSKNIFLLFYKNILYLKFINIY